MQVDHLQSLPVWLKRTSNCLIIYAHLRHISRFWIVTNWHFFYCWKMYHSQANAAGTWRGRTLSREQLFIHPFDKSRIIQTGFIPSITGHCLCCFIDQVYNDVITFLQSEFWEASICSLRITGFSAPFTCWPYRFFELALLILAKSCTVTD